MYYTDTSQNNLCIKAPLVSLLRPKFFVLTHMRDKILMFHQKTESQGHSQYTTFQYWNVFTVNTSENEGHRGKNMGHKWMSTVLISQHAK
jgi:hypothetical protein